MPATFQNAVSSVALVNVSVMQGLLAWHKAGMAEPLLLTTQLVEQVDPDRQHTPPTAVPQLSLMVLLLPTVTQLLTEELELFSSTSSLELVTLPVTVVELPSSTFFLATMLPVTWLLELCNMTVSSEAMFPVTVQPLPMVTSFLAVMPPPTDEPELFKVTLSLVLVTLPATVALLSSVTSFLAVTLPPTATEVFKVTFPSTALTSPVMRSLEPVTTSPVLAVRLEPKVLPPFVVISLALMEPVTVVA